MRERRVLDDKPSRPVDRHILNYTRTTNPKTIHPDSTAVTVYTHLSFTNILASSQPPHTYNANIRIQASPRARFARTLLFARTSAKMCAQLHTHTHTYTHTYTLSISLHSTYTCSPIIYSQMNNTLTHQHPRHQIYSTWRPLLHVCDKIKKEPLQVLCQLCCDQPTTRRMYTQYECRTRSILDTHLYMLTHIKQII